MSEADRNPSRNPSQSQSGGIQSLDSALRLLDALAKRSGPTALSDLARDCAMPVSKAHRYLASFAHAGLVRQAGKSGKYDLGPGAIQLGLAAMARNDAINLFDAGATLVDILAYGDQDFAGSIRTQEVSGNPITAAALGANDPFQWQLSFVGDSYGSYTALTGEIGNPGSFNIPAPASAALMGLAGLVAGRRKR